MKKEDIVKVLKSDCKLLYNGAFCKATYTAMGFYVSYNRKEKKLCYSAELLDKCGNSTIRVPIEDVTILDD